MTNDDKELLRHAVLEVLTTRHPAALPVGGIARRVRTQMDVDCTEEEVMGALELLKGMELVKSQYDELGGSTWWQATPAGVLAVERKG
jgi:hypothetical protein